MSKSEIIERIANIHNTLAQIQVAGDNAIAMAAALIDLRDMSRGLKKDIDEEDAAGAGEDNASKK